MSRRGAWKLRVALLAGLCAATAGWAADDDDELPPPPKKKAWVNTWFTPKPRPQTRPPKPAAKNSKDAKDNKESVKKAPPVDAAQARRSKELADYLRRLAVIDQLTQVAFDTRDEELLKQVNQAKERVWLTYKLRTVGPRTHPETDEQILDKHLGPTAAADQDGDVLLGAGRAKDPAGRTASKEDYRR